MTASTCHVTHHRVDAAVHAAAKAKAVRDGVSLSAVAAAGLSAYVATASSSVAARAASKVKAGSLAADAPALPAATADTLTRMGRDKDPVLLPFLAALRAAGWSYACLAAPLGITRQAVHLRLSNWTDPGTALALPAVPAGPGRTSFPAHPSSAPGARFDWAIWVDTDLYALAAEHARSRGDAMRELMETMLRDYAAGRLTVSGAQKTQAPKPRRARRTTTRPTTKGRTRS